jgi:hypothetical protein
MLGRATVVLNLDQEDGEAAVQPAQVCCSLLSDIETLVMVWQLCRHHCAQWLDSRATPTWGTLCSWWPRLSHLPLSRKSTPSKGFNTCKQVCHCRCQNCKSTGASPPPVKPSSAKACFSTCRVVEVYSGDRLMGKRVSVCAALHFLTWSGLCMNISRASMCSATCSQLYAGNLCLAGCFATGHLDSCHAKVLSPFLRRGLRLAGVVMSPVRAPSHQLLAGELSPQCICCCP